MKVRIRTRLVPAYFVVLVSWCAMVWGLCIGGCRSGVDSGSKTADVARNYPPVIGEVDIVPKDPGKESLLQAVVNAQDSDGDVVQLRYQWRRNGADIPGATEKTLEGNTLSKRDRVSVRVIPFDGKDEGEPVESPSVEIQNSAPVLDSVEVRPFSATTIDRLEANVSAHDIDDDPVTIVYQWNKNKEFLQGENRRILEAGLFKKGDLMAVTAEPNDGETTGVRMTSQDIRIQNAPPRISSTPPRGGIDKKEGFRYQIVASDPDGDPLRFSLVNGPNGMSIDPASGLLTWMVPEDSKSGFTVEILVEDGDGGRAIQRFYINIDTAQ